MDSNTEDSSNHPKPKLKNAHITVSIPDEHYDESKYKRWAKSCLVVAKHNILLVLLLVSVFCGIGIGFAIRRARGGRPYTEREIVYITFPGELLMRMLRMLILPLIVSSLIAGIAGLDARTCGKMGLRTMAYFATTTLLAVILGIILATSIKPGGEGGRDDIPRYGSAKRVNSVDTFMDLIR